jgi:hypothetical protein
MNHWTSRAPTMRRRLNDPRGALLLAAALIACGPDRQVRPSGPTRSSLLADAMAPTPPAEWSFRYSPANNLTIDLGGGSRRGGDERRTLADQPQRARAGGGPLLRADRVCHTRRAGGARVRDSRGDDLPRSGGVSARAARSPAPSARHAPPRRGGRARGRPRGRRGALAHPRRGQDVVAPADGRKSEVSGCAGDDARRAGGTSPLAAAFAGDGRRRGDVVLDRTAARRNRQPPPPRGFHLRGERHVA